MRIIASGLSGTIGRKLDKDIKSAKLLLGSERLIDHFDPSETPVTLIHLGGIVGEAEVTQNLPYSKLINVDETLRLAQEVIEDFGGRFIHISSSHVYGPSKSPLSENSAYNPQSNYAAQKVLAEKLLLEYFGDNNSNLLILRVFSVLGWDVSDSSLGGVVKRIISGSGETVVNSDDIRDFMTPTTIGRAISTIAKESQISGIFNLCTGISHTVGDVVRSMFRVQNFRENPKQILPGNSGTPKIIGDNSKLIATGINLELNWEPEKDL